MLKNFIFIISLLGIAALYGQDNTTVPTRKVAKSIIEIWVWGGPSQLETFDPKPDAGRDYNNSLKAIPTNVPGVYLSEMLPKLAMQADKFSIIRSMTHEYNGHETATYLMQTGRAPGNGLIYPSIGSVIAMFKSKEYTGQLPPYIALTTGKGRFSESGFLGERYSPLVTGGNPNADQFIVDGIIPPGGLHPEQIMARKNLMNELDTFGLAAGTNPKLYEFDQCTSAVEAVINGKAGTVFNLSLETQETRNRYGRNQFGQSCLAARRMVEAGIPYITINAQGWDSHKHHFETMKQRTAEMDQGLAALLADLSERKLLDTTIVWWSGEFGRTPKIAWEAPWNGGRNHYSRCFSAMVAGGGFKGGMVVGASDPLGEKVASRPVAPQDLLGSIYELAGINPDGPLPNPGNLKVTVLPPQSPAGRLRELYKDNKP